MPTLRPLSPLSPDRAAWEMEVCHCICELYDMTNGDAQGVVEVVPDLVDECWAAKTTPVETAHRVMSRSHAS
ncbi:hypothetical protein E4T66_17390 [Sinimarinibacterium sp. CAU 1509]|uniref:hypothetical protein n=1 Tax=Sinimarinibacterium sp. CAU 1509 TaxID=2562283 RepID=UPI0010ACFF8B|nr:hypothetical protein [Sinimarinibacterium sp. CAU 1509]TJY57185.1 hypothetical protein E4T66_17390 [Sinimarinibacterium sp. CAU 1509]